MPFISFADDSNWVFLVGLCLVGLLGVQSARLWVANNRPRFRLAKHRKQGAEGERIAEQLLASAGYDIEAKQAVARYELWVDGAPQTVTVRADFLVRRGGRRFVAEAKGGQLASRITTSATRRQLIEYFIAFGVDEVLLVDATRGRIASVALKAPEVQKGSPTPYLLGALLILLSVAIGWYALAR